MKLIDTIRVVAGSPGDGELLAPQTSLLFGSAAAGGVGKNQAELSGTDGFEYHFRGILKLVQNNPLITLRPNELATDQFGLGLNGATTATSFQESNLHIVSGTLTQPLTGSFECSFDPNDGEFSVYRCPISGLREDGVSGAANDYRVRAFGSVWEDILATFNRAAIHSSVAGAFGAGTYVRLYRIKGQL